MAIKFSTCASIIAALYCGLVVVVLTISVEHERAVLNPLTTPTTPAVIKEVRGLRVEVPENEEALPDNKAPVLPAEPTPENSTRKTPPAIKMKELCLNTSCEANNLGTCQETGICQCLPGVFGDDCTQCGTWTQWTDMGLDPYEYRGCSKQYTNCVAVCEGQQVRRRRNKRSISQTNLTAISCLFPKDQDYITTGCSCPGWFYREVHLARLNDGEYYQLTETCRTKINTFRQVGQISLWAFFIALGIAIVLFFTLIGILIWGCRTVLCVARNVV